MKNNNQQAFSNMKKEIKNKIKNENNNLNSIKKEKDEIIRANKGYENFLSELNSFIIESMQDFTVIEEDLPKYFKSNINEVYQNYSRIRQEALAEIDTLNKYIETCNKSLSSNKRSLKFYRSQYFDSDIFQECLPLVEILEEKNRLYEENIILIQEVIGVLEKIAKKLEKWV